MERSKVHNGGPYGESFDSNGWCKGNWNYGASKGRLSVWILHTWHTSHVGKGFGARWFRFHDLASCGFENFMTYGSIR